MRLRLALLAAFVLAALLGLAACGGDDGNNSPAATLIGTWSGTDDMGNTNEFQFAEDGSFQAFVVGFGQVDQGQYETEGDLLTFRRDDENSNCPGTTGQYRVTLDGADTFNFELVEDDECGEAAAFTPAANPYERTSG